MKLKNLKYKLSTSVDSNVIVMVGVPLSGKTTLIKELLEIKDFDIISRDDIVMELGDGKNYQDAFKSVNQKEVDRLLKERISDLGKSDTNVIIDMTNLGSKRRKIHLSHFPDHVKIALVISPPKMEVLLERNDNRFKEEGKFIPKGVINDMLRNFKYPSKEEGFNFIVDV